ncbi:hypothetical protein N0592_25715, partial [Pseudomonas aeruginosa]|nr:hypothetical protein [Pseudomonas aeruginosa]
RPYVTVTARSLPQGQAVLRGSRVESQPGNAGFNKTRRTSIRPLETTVWESYDYEASSSA